MLNVHLNGEIVRCPDISAIQNRLAEDRARHRVCKYNVHEDHCKAWQDSLINWQSIKRENNCGRCMLSGSEVCPGYLRSKETGNKEKTYKIDGIVYRKLTSAAHYMVKQSKNKTVFVTLTLPPFKRKVHEKEINQAFSRFVENLHNTYGVEYYIAVRERGKKTGRYHFHLLFSCKFIDFAILNTAWCHAISNFCEASPNAFSSKKNQVILYNPRSALKYICKYISKSRGQASKSRIVFMALPLILKPVREYCSIEDILQGFDSVEVIQTSDYTTCFRIKDHIEFDHFCTKYLYNLFKLSNKTCDFSGVPGSLN